MTEEDAESKALSQMEINARLNTIEEVLGIRYGQDAKEAIAGVAARVNALVKAGAHVELQLKENPDSITLGAPSSGQIKVHGDAGKPELWDARITAAQALMRDARQREIADIEATKAARTQGKV